MLSYSQGMKPPTSLFWNICYPIPGREASYAVVLKYVILFPGYEAPYVVLKYNL